MLAYLEYCGLQHLLSLEFLKEADRKSVLSLLANGTAVLSLITGYFGVFLWQVIAWGLSAQMGTC